MSIEGVALATVMTHTLNFLISYIWISIDHSIVKEGSWHFINKDSFIGIFEFLRYGIPSYLNLALEIWSFQAMHFMAGLLGIPQLGASVILINLQAFLYMVPLGISFVSASLIGNNLGASNPRKAKVFVNVSFIIVLILSSIFSI